MDFYQALQIFDRIPILNMNNWLSWNFKFEMAIKQVGLWHLIDFQDENSHCLIEKDHEIELDRRARTLIGLWVDDSMVEIIMDKPTAKQMWKALVSYFKNDQIKSSLTTGITCETPIVELQKAESEVEELVNTKNSLEKKIDNSNGKSLENNRESGCSSNIEDGESEIDQNEENENDNMNNNSETILIDVENPTVANFKIHDFGLYPKLREIDQSFLMEVEKFYVPLSNSLALFVSKDQRYWAFFLQRRSNSIYPKDPVEITKLRNKNVIFFTIQFSQFFLLTDEGELYQSDFCEFDPTPDGKLCLVLVKKNVLKFCASLNHTMILDYDGSIWIDLGYRPPKDFFHNCLIKDITYTASGLVAVTDHNQIFLWETFGPLCFERPIEFEIDDNDEPLKQVIGASSSFMVLTTQGKVIWCPCDKEFKWKSIETPEPIDSLCQVAITEEAFLLIGISGWCYVWDGSKNKLIVSCTDSIPDTVSLYTRAHTPATKWSYLPKEPQRIMDSLNELKSFNDHRSFSHLFMVENYENKEICYQGSENRNSTECIPMYLTMQYRVAYSFLRFICTKNCVITPKIISKAYQLLVDYQQANSKKKRSRKSKKK